MGPDPPDRPDQAQICAPLTSVAERFVPYSVFAQKSTFSRCSRQQQQPRNRRNVEERNAASPGMEARHWPGLKPDSALKQCRTPPRKQNLLTCSYLCGLHMWNVAYWSPSEIKSPDVDFQAQTSESSQTQLPSAGWTDGSNSTSL